MGASLEALLQVPLVEEPIPLRRSPGNSCEQEDVGRPLQCRSPASRQPAHQRPSTTRSVGQTTSGPAKKSGVKRVLSILRALQFSCFLNYWLAISPLYMGPIPLERVVRSDEPLKIILLSSRRAGDGHLHRCERAPERQLPSQRGGESPYIANQTANRFLRVYR